MDIFNRLRSWSRKSLSILVIKLWCRNHATIWTSNLSSSSRRWSGLRHRLMNAYQMELDRTAAPTSRIAFWVKVHRPWIKMSVQRHLEKLSNLQTSRSKAPRSSYWNHSKYRAMSQWRQALKAMKRKHYGLKYSKNLPGSSRRAVRMTKVTGVLINCNINQAKIPDHVSSNLRNRRWTRVWPQVVQKARIRKLKRRF